MAEYPRDRPHLFLAGGGLAQAYQRPPRRIEPKPLPLRDRIEHAAALELSIGTALEAARGQLARRDAAGAEGVAGFYLEIEVQPGEKAVIDQLANQTKKIEVVAVREPTEPEATVTATVFVPATAETYYQDKVTDYRTQNTGKAPILRARRSPVSSKEKEPVAGLCDGLLWKPGGYEETRAAVWGPAGRILIPT